ncbi:hypothetical protein M0802_011643 [Mischocyttarus mexicanus]|nr:hypothetical protein M0802_011643 [Mischocyttarus mexicanus]
MSRQITTTTTFLGSTNASSQMIPPPSPSPPLLTTTTTTTTTTSKRSTTNTTTTTIINTTISISISILRFSFYSPSLLPSLLHSDPPTSLPLAPLRSSNVDPVRSRGAGIVARSP